MLRTLLVFAAAAVLASRALAADVPDAPRVQLALGYAYLHDSDLRLESQPVGWYASISGSLSDRVGIVVDVGGNYNSTEGPSVDVHAFHVGPRLARHRSHGIAPFVQLLAGVTRRHTSTGTGTHETSTAFSLQPGVGITIPVSARVALGLGGDYRAIFAEGGASNEFRFTTGVVFRWGSR